MKSIWKGSISFGLVNIPIALGTAVREEGIKFRMLRGKDMSPIKFKRVAEADGKEVPWDEIVKGYEYAKEQFVIMKEEDFEKAGQAAGHTITMLAFVDLSDVSPLHFEKPYYVEPQKGADAAYVLLRDALAASGKIGIARVVISSKEHLAAVKPQGDLLILELMHFADEIVDENEVRKPNAPAAGKKELEMARLLIENMSEQWNPQAYKDDYRQRLEAVIAEKVKAGGKTPTKAATAAKSAQIINLMDALTASLKSVGGAGKKPRKKAG
jgi:DNA end-binding protein Ku